MNKDSGISQGELGFFDRIRISLFKSSIEKELKKKRMKKLSKEINKFMKGAYNIKTKKVSSEFGAYIYEIYKLIHGLINSMKIDFINEKGVKIQQYLITQNLTDTQKSIVKSIDEENMRRNIVQIGAQKTLDFINDEISRMMNYFNKDTIIGINNTYNRLAGFSKFILYDFYILFKEFDNDFSGESASDDIRFKDSDGKYLIEDLMKLNKALTSVVFNSNLYAVFKNYEQFHELPIIDKKNFSKLMNMVNKLKKTKVVQNLIKIISGNFSYSMNMEYSNKDIVSNYGNTVYFDCKNIWTSLVTQNRNSKINKLQSDVFGETKILRLYHYTLEMSERLKRNNFTTFSLCKPMALLRTFYIEKYKINISNTINELIIKGDFADSSFQGKLSDVYYKAEKIQKTIFDFDTELSEEKKTGNTIKTYIHSTDKEKSKRKHLDEVVIGVNKNAKIIITNGIEYLLEIERLLRTLIDAYKSDSMDIITNIKTIHEKGNPEFIKKIAHSVRVCSYFTHLMKYYINLDNS